MLTAEQIRERIAKLEAERQQLIEAANQRIAALSGKIEAWNEMLTLMENEEGEAEDGRE